MRKRMKMKTESRRNMGGGDKGGREGRRRGEEKDGGKKEKVTLHIIAITQS